jgi:phytoene dehydrogenase-like protein
VNFRRGAAVAAPSLPGMPATRSYDVIFVGAGHNALVAAAYLVKAGRSVCLLERAPQPGGWVRSEELTIPGFVHDTYSALHPTLAQGPVLRELGAELAEYGLRYVQGPVSTGASLPGGRTAVIGTDPGALADELDRLGERAAWERLGSDMAPYLQPLIQLLGLDLSSSEAGALLASLHQGSARAALPFATLLTGTGHELIRERFRSGELRYALLPWLLHLGIGPQDAGGALWAGLVPALLAGGNPTPVGGSGRLAEALSALVAGRGGEIRTGVDVDTVLVEDGQAAGVRTADGEELQASVAVVASTTPDQLYGRLLRDVGAVADAIRAQVARYRYRRGCFQLNLALSARPRFSDPRLDDGGAINIGRGVEELITSVRQAEDGLLPAYPSISWHEPTAVDSERAPAGRAVVRLQVLDAPLQPVGDAADEISADGGWTQSVAERFADRVIAEAAEHVEGLPELIMARHILSPADLARTSPNAGPGDHASGHNALSQGFGQRPIPAHRGGYCSAVPGVYLIGAATWPGPGVSGASGRTLARELLAS